MRTGKTLEPLANSAGQKRRRSMIDAAYSLFTENGYTSVSIDDIIRVSGGSKSSLYKFFGNKEGILKAVVESLGDEMLRDIRLELPSGGTPREALNRIGMVLADLALSEKAINQQRHAVSHAREYPELAKLWYETGPKGTFEGITEHMKKETKRGRLRIADPSRATDLFAGMIMFQENMRMMAGLPPLKRSARKELVAEAVEVFLAAYGV